MALGRKTVPQPWVIRGSVLRVEPGFRENKIYGTFREGAPLQGILLTADWPFQGSVHLSCCSVLIDIQIMEEVRMGVTVLAV